MRSCPSGLGGGVALLRARHGVRKAVEQLPEPARKQDRADDLGHATLQAGGNDPLSSWTKVSSRAGVRAKRVYVPVAIQRKLTSRRCSIGSRSRHCRPRRGTRSGARSACIRRAHRPQPVELGPPARMRLGVAHHRPDILNRRLDQSVAPVQIGHSVDHRPPGCRPLDLAGSGERLRTWATRPERRPSKRRRRPTTVMSAATAASWLGRSSPPPAFATASEPSTWAPDRAA